MKGIDLEVARGELVTPIGANGAGKTTMKAITGLKPYTIGDVEYMGESVKGVPPHLLLKKGLAMARAIISRPKLLLQDEPSMGLSPIMVEKIFEVIRSISGEGMTALLVEQNARLALQAANRGYVMDSGLVTMSGDAKQMLDDPKVRTAYLGE